MQRLIKFRGKRLDNGEWVYGGVTTYGEHAFIVRAELQISESDNMYFSTTGIEVIPATVGQYTGLKDSKRTEEYPEGQEIYEGDIIKAVALANDHNQRGAITISAVEYWMGNACLKITYIPLYPFIVDHSFEVISNIHDNPDLLKEVTPC